MNSVFKYCSPKSHYYDVLSNYQVNCSHPRFLNDKYESAEYLIEPHNKFCAAIKWGKAQKQQFDNHAIASFTNAEKAENVHLWKEYADQGRGFAVEYDAEKLKKEVFEQFILPAHLQQVKYIDGAFELDDFNNIFYSEAREEWLTVGQCIEAYNGIERNIEPLERLFQHLRLIKNKNVWHEEKESRIIIGNINYNYKCLHQTPYGYNLELPIGTIKSITMGPAMSEANRNTLKQIAKNIGISIAEYVSK